jgi:hypothetical protein
MSSTSPLSLAAQVELADLLGHARDLVGAGVDHPLVVVRRVGDVAGQAVLLDAADAVLEAGGAGDGPGPGQGRRVALVDVVAGRLARVADVEPIELGDVGQQPRLAAVGDVAVRQQRSRAPCT